MKSAHRQLSIVYPAPARIDWIGSDRIGSDCIGVHERAMRWSRRSRRSWLEWEKYSIPIQPTRSPSSRAIQSGRRRMADAKAVLASHLISSRLIAWHLLSSSFCNKLSDPIKSGCLCERESKSKNERELLSSGCQSTHRVCLRWKRAAFKVAHHLWLPPVYLSLRLILSRSFYLSLARFHGDCSVLLRAHHICSGRLENGSGIKDGWI